jgi:hypothetical protein
MGSTNTGAPETSPRWGRVRGAAGYLAGAVLALALAAYTLDLRHADLRVPFNLPGDGVYYAMLVQTMLETGWVHVNPRLSAPFGLELYDFAHFDSLHLAVMKVIGWFRPNWAVILNVYYLLTFPLTAVTALVLLRALRLAWAPALALGVLYAVQPYPFLRTQGHIMLAAYYLVPLQVLVVLWLAGPRALARDESDHAWPFRSARLWVAALVALAASSAGHYYASFGCFFGLVAAAGCAPAPRGRNLRHAAFVCAVTATGFALNLAPRVAYWMEHGSNRPVSAKLPQFSEQFGLKVVQLFMPVPGHRLAPFRRLAEHYAATSPLINENVSSSVGLIAGLGFLLLLLRALLRGRSFSELDTFGRLAVAGVLLGGVGGLGTTFSYLVNPQIHGYNRLSIWLALFGLVAVGLVLRAALARVARPGWRGLAAGTAGALLLGLGWYDQCSPTFAPPHAALRAEFAEHAAFGRRIMERVPPGTAVFALPLSAFPFDNGQIGYGHLHLYLHTTGLRWSDPAMRNRRAAAWHEEVAARPPAEMLETLALAGFGGILLDVRLNRPCDHELLRAVTALCAVEPVFDGRGRYFFDLRPYAERLRQGYSPGEWDRQARATVPPVYVTWGPDWRILETGPQAPWRAWHWCLKPQAAIVLVNPCGRPVTTDLDLTLYPADEATRQVQITGGLFTDDETVSSAGAHVHRRVTVPPGRHAVRFRCDGGPRQVGPSALWFRVESLTVVEVPAGS